MGDRIIDVILIARSVVDGIDKIGKLTFPVPVTDGILPVLREQAGGAKFPIMLSRREWKREQFHSALFRYTDHALIVYSTDLNRCWRRFAICKELVHLLMDVKACHMGTDPINLIQGLITGTFPMEADTPVHSDMVGAIAAVEMLLPWKLRPHLIQLRTNGKTDFEIAEHARVPEKYVSLILGAYGDVSARLNQDLDGSA